MKKILSYKFLITLGRHRELKITLLVVILFISLAIIFLFPALFGLIPLPLDLLVSRYGPWHEANTILLKNPYMQDSITQLYPWRHLVYTSLSNGILPLWNPYQFMGMPFMATLKPMLFYPLNILFFLGETRSWTTLLFMQIFLSMTTSYLLMKEFRLSTIVSVLVAISFALNSLMISTLQFGHEGHVLLWFPLFLFFAKKYLDSPSPLYIVGLSLSIATSIFAGQLQYVAYGMIVLIAFIIFFGFKKNPKLLAIILLGILLGVGITSIQLVPSLEIFIQSYRGLSDSYDLFATSLMPPHHIFRLFAPDLFGNPVTNDSVIGYIEHSGYFGIIPLFFAIYAMRFCIKKRLVKFFTIIFALFYVLSVQGFGQLLYFLHIPLITSGYGERAFSMVLFAGSILSGFGLTHYLNNEHTRKKVFVILGFSLAFFAVMGASVLFKNFTGTITAYENIQFPLMIYFAFLIIIAAYEIFKKRVKHHKILLVAILIVLTFFDLFRFGYRFLTFSNEKFLYPSLPVVEFIKSSQTNNLDRTYGLTEPEIATYLGIYTIETYNPLYIHRTGTMLNSLQGNQSELPVNKYLLSTGNGDRLKYTLDFLGASYIVTKKENNPATQYFKSPKYQSSLEQVYRDEIYSVYKNKDAFPRFKLFYKYSVTSDEDALKIISNPNFPKDKLVLSQTPNQSTYVGSGSAKIIYSDINSQTYQVTSTGKGIFYVSDTFFPGWNAYVNNSPTPIYRANYNFRAIEIPKGDSIVSFVYMPNSLKIGFILTLLSSAGLLVLSLLHKRFKFITN